jgi:hypothetical protein
MPLIPRPDRPGIRFRPRRCRAAASATLIARRRARRCRAAASATLSRGGERDADRGVRVDARRVSLLHGSHSAYAARDRLAGATDRDLHDTV